MNVVKPFGTHRSYAHKLSASLIGFNLLAFVPDPIKINPISLKALDKRYLCYRLDQV